MTRRRLSRCAALAALALMAAACGGVVDRDGSALNPPPGGWDNHGPV